MPSSHWLVALPIALILLGLALASAVTAVRGRAGSLSRTGRLGVRSEAAVRSDLAFKLANRVAWPIVAAAAGVAGFCGLVILVAPLALSTTLVIFALALIGSTALLIKAGQLGDRSAQAMPKPATRPGGTSCGGCACGGGGCAVLKKGSPSETAAG